MLIGEPPPTQGDLHFRLLGFPVRVHPFFWLVTLFLGLRADVDAVDMLIWIGVVFVSILIHELGHATMQRHYGGHPWITLYSFGGLASCNDCDRSPWRQIVILLAGPGAGFLLAICVLGALRASGHVAGFALSQNRLSPQLPAGTVYGPLGPCVVYFGHLDSTILKRIIWDLLQVNIMWGLFNLLPIYPLDGGQISRELFTLRNPRNGIYLSLQISVAVAVLIAVYAGLHQDIYLALMFGYLAYASFQTYQAYRNHWR